MTTSTQLILTAVAFFIGGVFGLIGILTIPLHDVRARRGLVGRIAVMVTGSLVLIWTQPLMVPFFAFLMEG